MTLMLFFGCGLVAYGMPLVLFVKFVYSRAQLVIVLLSAAMFWIMALMVSAIVWAIVPPLKSSYWVYIPVGVLTQEATRLAYYRFYEKAERTFEVMSTNAVVFPLSDLSSSLAAGLGFGLAQSLMLYGNILSHANGPGTLVSPYCDDMSVFVLSAWLSLLFILLHIALMVLAFDAFRRANLPQALIVLSLHLLASMLTVINKQDDGCLTALPLVALTTLTSMLYAGWVTHRDDYRSLKQN